MKDIYRELMTRSYKDAAEVVEQFNVEVAGQYESIDSVPSSAIPRIAMTLYQSRIARPEVVDMDEGSKTGFQ